MSPKASLTAARDIPFAPALAAALNSAKSEAIRCGDDHVRPEHVLLGLLHPATAPRAMLVLEALGIPADHLRAAPEPAVPAAALAGGHELPWDWQAKQVLARGIGHARERGRFTTDDVLLALAEGRKGFAAELLRWKGASPERIRAAAESLPKSLER